MDESPLIEGSPPNWERVLWNERAPRLFYTRRPLEVGPENPSDRLTDPIFRNAPLAISPSTVIAASRHFILSGRYLT